MSEQLRRQRGQLKAKLTASRNFATRITENLELTTREEVETRLQNLEEAYVRFQGIAQQLLSVVPEEEYEQRDAAEEVEFDDRYFAVKASLLQCVERLRSPSDASPSGNENRGNDSALAQVLEQQAMIMQQLAERSNETSGNGVLSQILEQQSRMLERLSVQSGTPREPQVKLPIIKLPTFNGNIEEWKRYADTFKTLIHESELPNVQKHQYLVGSLSGPAAKIIESIEISDQNYAIAWELLKKRYEDERAIRKRHIQCLFELPRVHRESASAIQELLDHVQKHLRVLQSMKLPTESWGELIIYLIERNLDSTTRRRWEEHVELLENITTSSMTEFLQRRCQVLERASFDGDTRDTTGRLKFDGHERSDGNKQRYSSNLKAQTKSSLATTFQGGKCYLCQGQHLIYSCNRFLGLSAENRMQEARRLKLCINCLRNDHFIKDCRSSSCRECGERHNTLCHSTRGGTGSTTSFKRRTARSSEELSANTASASARNAEREMNLGESSSSASVHHMLSEAERKRVLMSTAIVNVKGGNGQLRILLDSASEINFITMTACKKLNLKVEDIHESINGLNDMSCGIRHGCRVQIQSRVSSFGMSFYCLVVPKITKKLPSFSINASQLAIPKNLKLADPFFYNPNIVDVLVGGEFFFQLLENGRIQLSEGLPILQNSKLGWIIAGSIPESLIVNTTTDRQSSTIHTCLFTQQESINDTMVRFWELEEYQSKKTKLSTEEQQCENYFVNSITRDVSGRFIVRLPFRENKTQLGESREIAKRRLLYLERKFQTKSSFHRQYLEFMREYMELDHMTEINEEADINDCVYLPHHGVLRESSLTTKLRVVFDASAKTASGVSLNDTLMVGANLQDNIINIILRFRLHNIAITADLQKMYRQILVHKQDRDYQRILWRFSPSEPMKKFRLNTVTYGLASAPFLAIRCLKYLASKASDNCKQASQALLNDLYVDDMLTGVDSKDDAINLISQLKNLLNSGGFEPHKWRSNCKEIINDLGLSDRVEESSKVAIDTSTIKTLGLSWHPEQDTFQFSIQSLAGSNGTKREVLSAISKLFDPLGLISPILVRAKLIMQRAWAANLEWDEPLTSDLQQAWNAYADDLGEIHTIRVPRRVVSGSGAIRFCLHAFCDASLKAYGACIYLQTIDGENNSSSVLLCSKSRVAPIKNKTVTLPKLELCGAIVLVRLLKNVTEALKIEFNEVHAWSDSTIALAWISGDPSRQKMFVSNRTAEIQSILSSEQWHHVRSEDNPADLVSRGISLKELKQCKLWWEGPIWLSEFRVYLRAGRRLTNPSQVEIKTIEAEQITESRVFLNMSDSQQTIQNLLENNSSLSKIERIVAWILRFVSNAGVDKGKRRFDSLSINEIKCAHQSLIMAVQANQFAEEKSRLIAKRQIGSASKLLSLSPFIDEKGILRVGGRIQNSSATFNKKHPILLPSDNKFTRLLFEREHNRLLHAGPQALLYAVRERYWPLKGKNIARKTVHDCMICFRNNPRPSSQIMGPLPADRVVLNRPFFVVGVDFAGPIVTLVNRGRGRKTNKSYISLFICFATKATHLEAVSDLSSAAFIAALRRFVGRRGCPQRICCDNATNFVGARNELAEVRRSIKENSQEINNEFCIPNNIDWKFIPPSSPHMGGLWEAGVKSCKFHLKRVVGQSLLTFEELATVLTQIEACMNSRPICQLSSTPTDLQPLTPGHFLIGEPLTNIPDIDVTDVPINRLDRWQLVQKITQDFWHRWNREYLTSLQGKTKWRFEKNNLAINDIVLIQDNNAPPLKWKLGKVVETHEGSDRKIRVVTLKTASGTCKRAIHKLCKLPMSDMLTT